MRRLLGGGIVLLLALYPCVRLAAHVRLIHPTSGAALEWTSPGSVPVVLSARGSDDVADASEEAALRLALAEWNAVPGSRARLVEEDSDESRAREDWQANDLHLLLFDEHNDSGFFPPGSATVALTPVRFYGSGRIADADVLFNGAGFRFTTSGEPGAFDVFNVATHELGHLLGLDHTGSSSGTMFPYVDQGQVLLRSLSEDERAGLRDAYPAGAFGVLSGTVVRAADGSPVSGAYLVARDSSGRTRASILADERGEFALRGLAPERYTVYARPLDWTVGEWNLGPAYGGRIDTDFEPRAYADEAVLQGAERLSLGVLEVGADVSLSLGWAVDEFPLRAAAGSLRTVYLHGSGLFTGSTLSASDPDLLLGPPAWQGTQVSFALEVPPEEAPGHVDLSVRNAEGALAILPAAIEITPPVPVVTALEPDVLRAAGGETLVLRGAHFAPGARVVIGGTVYTGGRELEVVDADTLSLRTGALEAGLHDVVVIDPSGVEGRSHEGLLVLSAPALRRILPAAGQAGGGTELVLVGSGFLEGLRVELDGVDQGPVRLEGTELARLTTLGGSGPGRLVLVNPDGERAEAGFAYVAQNDPELHGVTPASGPAGTRMTLTGRDFTPSMGVWFLSEPEAPPVAAERVTFVDSTTLEVVAPSLASGPCGLWVADGNGCGLFAESAFRLESSASRGGGCAAILGEGPGPRPGLELVGAVVLLLWLLQRTERTRSLSG